MFEGRRRQAEARRDRVAGSQTAQIGRLGTDHGDIMTFGLSEPQDFQVNLLTVARGLLIHSLFFGFCLPVLNFEICF